MPRLAGDEPAPLTSTAVLVPVLMTARLLQEHLQHTQVNLYVLFLILLAFHLFQQRHHGLGGLRWRRRRACAPFQYFSCPICSTNGRGARPPGRQGFSWSSTSSFP